MQNIIKIIKNNIPFLVIISIFLLIIALPLLNKFYFSYPDEPKLIGTYQLKDTIGKKNKRFITISLTSSAGKYAIKTYRDFNEPYYLPIFYVITHTHYIKYNAKKTNFIEKDDFIENNDRFKKYLNTLHLENTTLMQYDPASKKTILWEKISDNILTEKELNTNHYSVQKFDDMEWSMSQWDGSIKRIIQSNNN